MKVAIVLVSLLAIASSKKTPALVQELQAGPADIIIRFASTTPTLNNINSMKFATKVETRWAMYNALTDFANESHKKVQTLLKGKEMESVQLWISNEIYVKNASPELVEELLQFDEIVEIRENVRVPLYQPIEPQVSHKDNDILNEWNIVNVRAPEVHQAGNTGQGVVVSNIDTGVRYTHQDLSSNYRAFKGWFDPYTRSANPIDNNGHGTHTMGTIAGAGGLGVAPGAQWIACRGCDTSSCTNAALTECGQWTVCPTFANGSSPDCSLAPALSSNSWGGGRGSAWYDPVINGWHLAGVIPVFANGNSGSACNTANSPADSQAGAIAVGSTTNTNAISSFSSRGPSAFGTLKPDISAPGSSVRSAYHTSDIAYSTLSGTSMACPHVAGAVALILNQQPGLNYTQVANALYNTARRAVVSGSQTCNGVPDTVFPNHTFGYGILDAYAAVNYNATSSF